MRALLGLLPMLTGCQLVFGFQGEGVPGDDDGPDTPVDPDDATPDAPPTGPAIAGGDIDGDGLENAVDLCPLDPNITTLDTDMDGIGDACDPAINEKTCMVLLDGFENAGRPPLVGWVGDWVHESCEGTQAFCSPRKAGNSILYFDRNFGPVTRVDAVLAIRGERDVLDTRAELFALLDPAVGTGRACSIAKQAGGNGKAAVHDVQSGSSTELAFASTARAFLNDYILSWTPPGDETPRDCAVHPANGSQIRVDQVIDPQPTGDRIGVRAVNADVSLYAIVAYAAGDCPR